MTSIAYPAGTGISYTFDVAGRITSVTTPNGTVGYAFDTANRRTS